MYILWVVALLRACDVTQDGSQHGRHLGFYQKLEITKQLRKLNIFDVIHVKNDIINHFTVFCVQFVLFSHKKGEKHTVFTKSGVTIYYL